MTDAYEKERPLLAFAVAAAAFLGIQDLANGQYRHGSILLAAVLAFALTLTGLAGRNWWLARVHTLLAIYVVVAVAWGLR